MPTTADLTTEEGHAIAKAGMDLAKKRITRKQYKAIVAEIRNRVAERS